ncbi:MAG: fibronectin type III domain-containing protein [Sandaracinaceae bacterium]
MRWLPFAGGAAALLALTCSSPTATPANVAVANLNAFAVTITIASLDGERSEVFRDVLAEATTPAVTLPFDATEGVRVTCSDGGCLAGELTLVGGLDETVHVLSGRAPSLTTTPVTAPRVTALRPTDGSVDVGLNTTLGASFSEPMDPATITAGAADGECAGALQLSADDFETCVPMDDEPRSASPTTFAVTPASPLAPSTTYTFRVIATPASAGGRRVEASASASFTTGVASDEVAPSAVTDLAAAEATSDGVTLTWTAVGDDADVGQAQTYDVRYAAGACPFDVDTATEVEGEPSPQPAGRSEEFTARGLAPDASYCLAVIVIDDVGQASPPSNMVPVTLPPSTDEVAPGVPELAVTRSFVSGLRVSWRAVGDDGNEGVATGYELRYLPSGACPEHDGQRFVRGNPSPALPAPQHPGEQEHATLLQLVNGTEYCFVLAVRDEADNAAFSAPARGRTEDDADVW